MTDSQDKPNIPDSSSRLDELLMTVRAALASEAAAEARSAGAVACRAILATLDPQSRPAAGSPSVSPSPATVPPTPQSPIAAVLGAIGQIPRERLFEVLSGLRWLLGQPGPTYRPRPAPTRPEGGGP
jgi:hypothetical protein